MKYPTKNFISNPNLSHVTIFPALVIFISWTALHLYSNRSTTDYRKEKKLKIFIKVDI